MSGARTGPWELCLRAAEASDIVEVAGEARREVDLLLWNRGLRARQREVLAEVRLAEAQATLFIDGIDLPEPAWRSASVFDSSPMGRAAAGAWRAEKALADLAVTWRHAPIQALARAHVLYAGDVCSAEILGRPRQEADPPDDPLRLGTPPPVAGLASAVRDVLAPTAPSRLPAVVEAAIVQGELMALRPFDWGSGLVARLASRLAMAVRGIDPDFLVATDVAVAASGRPAYVRALRSYFHAREAPDDLSGIAQWVAFFCDATARGARWTSGLV